MANYTYSKLWQTIVNYGKAMARFGKLRQVLASSSNVCQILLKFIKKTVYVRTYIYIYRH